MKMQHMTICAGLAALALALTGTAAAEKTPLPPQASIPFINFGSTIRDWQANKTQGLWIQDSHRQWYYAQTMGHCMGLDWAWAIAFDTHRSNTLDHFSSIIVPREMRCPIQSLTRSDAPPKKIKQGKVAAEASISL